MKQDRTPRPNFIVFKFQMQNLNSWIQTSPKTKLKLGILGSFTLIFGCSVSKVWIFIRVYGGLEGLEFQILDYE